MEEEGRWKRRVDGRGVREDRERILLGDFDVLLRHR